MVRTTPIISSFTGGEVSPYLEGRTDLRSYYNSARILENMLVLPQGAAERRAGTRYIAGTKIGAARLIPFEFSDLQAYVIEAGLYYLRFYINKGQIILSNGVPYELATPYGLEDLADLRWCQSADVMYLVHPRHAPRKLSRSGHTAWTLTVADLLDGPYLDENVTDTTLTATAGTGSVTVTASDVAGINSGVGFVSQDVGRLLRMKSGTAWGYGKITGVWSPVSVGVEIKSPVGTAATKAWRLGLWSDNTGWPSTVTFHEERLVFGSATKLRPQRIDGSKIGDFETFAPGTEDSDAFAFSLGSNKVNKIRWLASMKSLLVGTVGAEFTVAADSANAPLTPSNAQAKPNTRYGCAAVAPVEVGQAVLFVQRQGTIVRELKYRFDADAYVAPNLTLLAEHITRTGIVDMVWQQEPYALLWCVLRDGQLVACTYLPEQEVTGWHRHPIGGAGAVESAAVIPGGAGSDQVWLVVRRTVNGRVCRYIEVIEDPLPLSGSQADAYYVDCGLTYSGPPVTQISGLDHLEGQTVQILADGGVHDDAVVSGGRITLKRQVRKAHVGLRYHARLQPMRIEAGAVQGSTAQGKTKLITQLSLRVLRSLGGEMGLTEASMQPILAGRDPRVPMDQPMPLYSGDVKLPFPGIWETTGSILIQQSLPLPLTILALIPRVVTADE